MYDIHTTKLLLCKESHALCDVILQTYCTLFLRWQLLNTPYLFLFLIDFFSNEIGTQLKFESVCPEHRSTQGLSTSQKLQCCNILRNKYQTFRKSKNLYLNFLNVVTYPYFFCHFAIFCLSKRAGNGKRLCNIYARKLYRDFSGNSLQSNFKYLLSKKSQLNYIQNRITRKMGLFSTTTPDGRSRVVSSSGISHTISQDSQGRTEGAMNALKERQEKLQKVLEKRRQAASASTEASSATPSTSDAADPITETPAPSEAVPDNKEARKSKKSKKFKKPKAVEKN